MAETPVAWHRQMLEWVFAAAPSGIALIEYDRHAGGEVVMVNPAMEELTGYDHDTLAGMPVYKLVPKISAQALQERNELIAGKRKYWSGEVLLHRADGARRNMHLTVSSLTRIEGSLVGIAHLSDITDENAREERLEFLSDHDPLTGLPDAQYMERSLAEVTRSAPRPGRPRALVFIDIDGLSYLNDRLGYDGGDQIIRGVASLAQEAGSDDGVTVRIGANRFAMLWPELDAGETLNSATNLLHSIRHSVLVPTRDDNHAGRGVTASAGVAIFGFGHDAISASKVMATADQALRKAKQGGRDCLVTLEVDEGSGDVADVTEIREQIRLAVDDEGMFRFDAQPIVDTASGDVTGHELLLRLEEADGGILMPGSFIPIAEATGLIRRLDRWVIRHGIEIAARGGVDGEGTRVWINISAQSLADERLVELVEEQLELRDVDPGRMVFEVTEREGSVEFRDVSRIITLLREVGCSCAIDDFGAGYGGFDHLKDMAFDIIKVDGRFIEGLAHSPVDRAITSGIVAAAKAAGRSVVAEFVTDQETLDMLAGIEVDCVQGQLIGMPAPVSA